MTGFLSSDGQICAPAIWATARKDLTRVWTIMLRGMVRGMVMTKRNIRVKDERWGGYVPWFLRYQDFSHGDRSQFYMFFDHLSHRLRQLILFNEAQVPNLLHFAFQLETASFREYRHQSGSNFHEEIGQYFDPNQLYSEVVISKFSGLSVLAYTAEQLEADRQLQENRSKNRQLFIRRVGTLEALLNILPPCNGTSTLVRDIKRIFAITQIPLDIRGNHPAIVPLEEPLLQQEVLDELLPRLSIKFPDRAKELIAAYHGIVQGGRTDDIFLGAFKSLEEIARSITGDGSFTFHAGDAKKYFPELHTTIHETVKKLAGHRGDKAGHGKGGPEIYEMRYLLFLICNIALLLLDYPQEKIKKNSKTPVK